MGVGVGVEVVVVLVVVVHRANTRLQAYSSQHHKLPTLRRDEGAVRTAFHVERSDRCAKPSMCLLWTPALPMPDLIEHPPSFAFIQGGLGAGST